MATPKTAADYSQLDFLAGNDAELAAQARLQKILRRHELAKTWPSGSLPKANLDAAADTPGEREESAPQVVPLGDSQAEVYNDGDIFRGRPHGVRKAP